MDRFEAELEAIMADALAMDPARMEVEDPKEGVAELIDRVCHRKQATMVKSLVLGPARNADVVAGRQSGKSHGGALATVLVAALIPGVNLIYVTSTYASCKRMAFLPAVLHNDTLELGGVPNYSEMSIAFPNGTVAYFIGADTERAISRLRGTPNLVLVIVDEAGIYSSDKLNEILEAVRPGLRPRAGKLCVMGTPNRHLGKRGTFYDISCNASYEHHRFDYRDNDKVPAYLNVEQLIDEDLQAQGETRDSTFFLAEYMALFVDDANQTAYRYDERCSFEYVEASWTRQVEPGVMLAINMPPGIDTVSIGVDPGGAVDRFAVVAVGWNSRRPTDLWQLFEWVTPRGVLVSWDIASAAIDVAAEAYPVAYYHYDAGGSSNELSLFSRTAGRYLLKAANKQDKHGQVEHVANLSKRLRLHVIAGSVLERDLKLSTWDRKALLAKRYEWSSAHHPDPADAARYAAQPFFILDDAAPRPKTEEQKIDEMVARFVNDRKRQDDPTANDLPSDLFSGYGDS